MKCPKCDLVTSNKRDICPRCECDLRSRKRELGLPISNPSIPLSQLVAELRKEQGSAQKGATPAKATSDKGAPEKTAVKAKEAAPAAAPAEADKAPRRSLFSRLWSPRAEPPAASHPQERAKSDDGKKNSNAPQTAVASAPPGHQTPSAAPAAAVLPRAAEPAASSVPAPSPETGAIDDVEGLSFAITPSASSAPQAAAAEEQSELDETSFDWIAPGSGAQFVRSAVAPSEPFPEQGSDEFSPSAFTEIAAPLAPRAAASGGGSLGMMEQSETPLPFATGSIDNELDDLLAELEAEQQLVPPDDDRLFPDLKRNEGDFDDILRELEGDAAPELDEMSLLEEPIAAITEVVREATTFTEEIRHRSFDPEPMPDVEAPESSAGSSDTSDALPDLDAPFDTAEQPTESLRDAAPPSSGLPVQDPSLAEDELSFEPLAPAVIAPTPTVTPEVMEFGEDDALLEQQLDAMLGDEILDIEAVPVPVAKQQKPSTSTTLHVDDDLEISFELEVEDDDHDGDDLAAETDTPPRSTDRAPAAAPAHEDPMMRQLLDTFEATEAGSAGTVAAARAASPTPPPNPEPPVIRSAEELRRAQSVLSMLPSLEDGLADELVKLLADAYGVHPATLKPRPEGPISDDVLQSLQSELDEELRALAQEGTTFLGTDLPEAAPSITAVESPSAAPVVDAVVSLRDEPASEPLTEEPLADPGLADLEALQAELGAEIEALEREGCSIHRDSESDGSPAGAVAPEIDAGGSSFAGSAETPGEQKEDAELLALAGELDLEYRELVAESAARLSDVQPGTMPRGADPLFETADAELEGTSAAADEQQPALFDGAEPTAADPITAVEDELDLAELTAELDAEYALLRAESLASTAESAASSPVTDDPDLSADLELIASAEDTFGETSEHSVTEQTASQEAVAPAIELDPSTELPSASSVESDDLTAELSQLTAELDSEYALFRNESLGHSSGASEEPPSEEGDELSEDLALLASMEATFGETTEHSVSETPQDGAATEVELDFDALRPLPAAEVDSEISQLSAELDAEYSLLKSEALGTDEPDIARDPGEVDPADLAEDLALLSSAELAFGETTEHSVTEVPRDAAEPPQADGLDTVHEHEAESSETEVSPLGETEPPALEALLETVPVDALDAIDTLPAEEHMFEPPAEPEGEAHAGLLHDEIDWSAIASPEVEAELPMVGVESPPQAELAGGAAAAALTSLPAGQAIALTAPDAAELARVAAHLEYGRFRPPVCDLIGTAVARLRSAFPEHLVAEGMVDDGAELADGAEAVIEARASFVSDALEDATATGMFFARDFERAVISNDSGGRDSIEGERPGDTDPSAPDTATDSGFPAHVNGAESTDRFLAADHSTAIGEHFVESQQRNAPSLDDLFEESTATEVYLLEDLRRYDPPTEESTGDSGGEPIEAAAEPHLSADEHARSAEPLEEASATGMFFVQDLARMDEPGDHAGTDATAPATEEPDGARAEAQDSPEVEAPTVGTDTVVDESEFAEPFEEASTTGMFLAQDIARVTAPSGDEGSAADSFDAVEVEAVSQLDGDRSQETEPAAAEAARALDGDDGAEPLDEGSSTGMFLARDIARVETDDDPRGETFAVPAEEHEADPFDDALHSASGNDPVDEEEHPFEEAAGVFSEAPESDEVDLGTIADAFTGNGAPSSTLSVRATRVNTGVKSLPPSSMNEPIESAVSTGVFLASDLQRIVAERPPQSRPTPPVSSPRTIDIPAQLWDDAERELAREAATGEEFEISAMEIGALEKGEEIALLFEVADDELRDPERARRHTEEIPASHKKKVDTGKLDAALDRFSRDQKQVSTKVQAIRAKKVELQKARIEQLLVPASILRRAGGMLIDTAFVLVATFILCFMTSMPDELKEAIASASFQDYRGMLFYAPTFLFNGLMVWVGSTILGVSLSGRTVGGRMMGIEVVDSVGEIPGFFQAVTRAFSQVTTLLTAGLGLLPLLGRKKRCLHDRLSRTFVRVAPEPLAEEESA